MSLGKCFYIHCTYVLEDFLFVCLMEATLPQFSCLILEDPKLANVFNMCYMISLCKRPHYIHQGTQTLLEGVHLSESSTSWRVVYWPRSDI